MIRYLQHKHINKEKWDNCISTSFNGIIYGYSWYLDIVAENWSALVENDYERVFPLCPQKKHGIQYIFQPLFIQQLGVFSIGILSEKIVNQFISSIPKPNKIVKINLNTHNKVSLNNAIFTNFKTFELDLINDIEDIRKRYATNLKRNLKKAAKNQLNVAFNIKPEDIIELYKKDDNKRHRSLTDSQLKKLSRLIYVIIYRGLAKIAGVYDQYNQLISGAFFITSNNKSIFLFSANSDEGRKLAGLPFLIDKYIEINARKNLTLDFEGSNNPTLARFYSGFGSKAVTYPHIEMYRFPFNLVKALINRF